MSIEHLRGSDSQRRVLSSNPFRRYLAGGDVTKPSELFKALMDPGTLIGDEETSELFGRIILQRTAEIVGSYADNVAPIDEETERIAERGQRLRERQA